MIVFTDKFELIPFIEAKFKQNAVVMNLSSAKSGLIDLTPLMTRIRYYNNTNMALNQIVGTVEFDMSYANMIQYDLLMCACLQKMVFASYVGELVIVMVIRDPYRDAIMESLIKLIQQRYGHQSWIVNDVDDIDDLKETRFTPMGLQIVDEEMNQYTQRYLDGYSDPLIAPINKE